MTRSCREVAIRRIEASIGDSAMANTGKGLQNPQRGFESHRRLKYQRSPGIQGFFVVFRRQSP